MHRFRRVTIWLFAVAVLGAVFSIDAVGAKASVEFERSFSLSEGGTVSVKNHNGSVRVGVSDGNRVLLRGRKTANKDEDLQRVAVETVESPERIDIETRIPRGLTGASVSYELEVPRGARIQVSSVNGSIRINGIHGETRAESVNGAVKIEGVAGSVTAKTVNGSLNVGWDSLEGSAKHSLKTVNGSLKIRMPGDAQGTFEVKTVNGSIRTDLPLEVRKGRFGRHGSISERIGQGGPEFALSTVNGSISVLAN